MSISIYPSQQPQLSAGDGTLVNIIKSGDQSALEVADTRTRLELARMTEHLGALLLYMEEIVGDDVTQGE